MTESVRLRSSALMRELMTAQGWSGHQLASRLPCGKSMVYALASGEKTTCTALLGERIAEVLRVPTSVLFAPDPSIRRGRPSKVAA